MPAADATPGDRLDPDLARSLELAEARATGDLYRAASALPGDPAGAVTADIGGGVAFGIGALDHPFFNRMVGLGIARPATEDAVEAASRFFVARGLTRTSVQVVPAVEASVAGWLEARGYRRKRRSLKLWHALDGAPPEARTDLRVERIDHSGAADFERIVLAAFELPPVVGPLVGASIGRAGWTHYLGFDGPTPVSVAALWVGDEAAWLAFGATLEAARGRGGQTAMFAARLRDARDLGCRWAITETGEETDEEPVNHSYRNMLRAGFTVAYARRNWVRIPDGG